MLLVLLSNIVEHCRFNNKGLDIFVFNDNSDNDWQYYYMIFMGAFDNVACPIVEHCRTLSFKQQGAW